MCLPGRGSRSPPAFLRKIPRNPRNCDALQALLAFSALHEQVRRRKALAARNAGFDAGPPVAEFEQGEQFVLDEVLQLVAERAVAITGADGLAIALAENNEIVLRAAAGTVRPDVGARIDRDSAFSGACFRTAQVVNCDDTETDPRVNLQACRKLGARSMVAVPLCGRRRVIGLLEAFSAWPFGFNDSDVRNLSLLAELVLGALKPEDEDRFAESAQVAAIKLEIPLSSSQPAKPTPAALAPAQAVQPAPSAPVVPVADKKTVDDKETAGEKKVVEAPVFSALAQASPEKPAVEKATKIEIAVTTAVVPQPQVSTPQPEPINRKPYALILLVGIVVATAFAGGVWWKLKTAQLSGAMIRTERMAARTSGAETHQEAPVSPPSTAATSVNSTSPDNATSDSMPDVNEPANSPATAQELSKFPRITGIRHWSSADSSTVVLDLEDQVQYEAHRLAGPDRIYFDLRDTQLAADLVGKSIDVGDAFISRDPHGSARGWHDAHCAGD